jgi:putative oxidoreductase
MNWHDLLRTRASGWVILIRLMVGLAMFFPEGIQKLIFPQILGTGRFTRIGIPLPDVMGPFVGVVEIVCGALIIVGLLTRLAAIPLIITMIVAIVSTKIPILLGHEFWIFHLPTFDRYGFWSAGRSSHVEDPTFQDLKVPPAELERHVTRGDASSCHLTDVIFSG